MFFFKNLLLHIPGTYYCTQYIQALVNLFEPFFTTKSNGHGIGLPAIRSMVMQQNGAIRVLNIKGSSGSDVIGACVSCYFPISKLPEVKFDTMINALKVSSSSPATSIKIWVIDDDSYVSEFINIALRGQGYDVDGFLTHAEVRARMGMIWRKEGGYKPPDLLLLDVQSDRRKTGGNNDSQQSKQLRNDSNGINGSCLSLLEDFKRINQPDMPVIFISGASSKHWKDDGNKSRRLQHFLQKPFTHNELVKCVNDFVLVINKRKAESTIL